MRFVDIKRLFELCTSDASFKERYEASGVEVFRPFGIEADPAILDTLLAAQPQDSCEAPDPESIPPDLKRYSEWQRERTLGFHRRFDVQRGDNHAYNGWRIRQFGRLATQIPSLKWVRMMLPLGFSIELSKGCSIRCDYCALAAGKLRAVARRTPENRRLFSEILQALKTFFNCGGSTGMIYGATEPLDNPDYELYLHDYFEVLGATPQTTTAAFSRNITRTRALLEQSRRENGYIERFSINTLEQLHRCMQEFTADELEMVELVIQTPESGLVQCYSGRGGLKNPEALRDTIACACGFLINLVDRSVRLITPSVDFDRWPLGYAIYRQAGFASGDELLEFMRGCQHDFMELEITDDLIPRFREDLEIQRTDEPAGDGDKDSESSAKSRGPRFALSAEFAELAFEEPIERALLEQIDGRRSLGEIIDRLEDQFSATDLYHRMSRLYECGLFDHLPEPTLDFDDYYPNADMTLRSSPKAE